MDGILSTQVAAISIWTIW